MVQTHTRTASEMFIVFNILNSRMLLCCHVARWHFVGGAAPDGRRRSTQWQRQQQWPKLGALNQGRGISFLWTSSDGDGNVGWQRLWASGCCPQQWLSGEEDLAFTFSFGWSRWWWLLAATVRERIEVVLTARSEEDCASLGSAMVLGTSLTPVMASRGVSKWRSL